LGKIGKKSFACALVLASTCLTSRPLFATGLFTSLPKFVDALTIPPKIILTGQGPHEITLTLGQFKASLHSSLPNTTEWGYNGTSPGPTIEVESGQAVRIHWKNELPTTHLFAEPKGIDMAKKLSCLASNLTASTAMPDVRAVTHIHGAVVSEPDAKDRDHNNDGWPDLWDVPGQEQITEVPNIQSAMTTWYHDHAMGETGRNVAAGLEGMYLIHDDYERSLNLPSGNYDVPIFLRARTVQDDGSLTYTDDLANEYYGNSVEVNGKLYPYFNVEPRKYRFRFLNGSNARSYSLDLTSQQDQTPGPLMVQVASDGGFLAKPAVLNNPNDPNTDRLELAPAERADIIIDFSKSAGQSFVLHNTDRDGDENEIDVPELMLFKVQAVPAVQDTSTVPLAMKPVVRMNHAPNRHWPRIDGGWSRDFKVKRKTLGRSNHRKTRDGNN
jgi:spore coat protein A